MTTPLRLTLPPFGSALVMAPLIAQNRHTVRVLRAQGLELRDLAAALAADLGQDEPAPARRAEIARMWSESDAMLDASDRVDQCGRSWVQYECLHGHISHLPYSCGRAALCPMCAAAESRKRVRLYEDRIRAALPGGRGDGAIRLRSATFSLRHRDDESLGEAFVRGRDCAKRASRMVWGCPAGKSEWADYFEQFPVSKREVKRAGSLRAAKKARREAVRADAQRSGFIVSMEYGAKSRRVHAHVLVVGRYVHQSVLSKVWKRVSGDSYVTHIGARGTVEQRINEGLKYVTKFSERSAGELVELFRSMLVFGKDARRCKGHEHPDGTRDPPCDVSVPLDSLVCPECGADTKYRVGGARCRRRVEALGVLRRKLPAEDEVFSLCCDECGELVHAVGVLTASQIEMGVWVVPEENRFRKPAPSV